MDFWGAEIWDSNYIFEVLSCSELPIYWIFWGFLEEKPILTFQIFNFWVTIDFQLFPRLQNQKFFNQILFFASRFPSFLYVAFGQMLTTVVILYLLKRLKFLSFPKMDVSIPEKIFPLPIFFAGFFKNNLVRGFGFSPVYASNQWW